MKNILLVLILLSLVGCAATPPKASVIVTNDSEVVVSDKSSQALRDIHAANIQGIRDLTIKEFNRHKKDIEHFEASAGSREGFNRLAYETGGVGLGLAAGLSMGTVLGYGAITALTADDRPENYSFAWDFDGRILVVSKTGLIDTEMLNSAIASTNNQLSELYPNYFGGELTNNLKVEENGLNKVSREEYNSKRKIKKVLEPDTYLASVSYTKTHSVPMRSFCQNQNQDGSCEIFVEFFDLSKGGRYAKRLPQANALLRVIASKLDEDYFLYLPPNRALYRLPMIVRGGTGEIEYLVEKE